MLDIPRIQIYEFVLGIPLSSRRHRTVEPDDYHLVQTIKFTGEEFLPNLVKAYKLAPQSFDMEIGYLAIISKPVGKVYFSDETPRRLLLLSMIDLTSWYLRIDSDPADRSSTIQLARESSWLLELGDDFRARSKSAFELPHVQL
ncbi:hypothetical protein SCP_1202000 [Sparassis crispa]|uniref:Uncharacterized protein n=1 Tax=Sparassis crispa TaxID=139825 RepID=A0A401H0N0_9APHY|nr:hypothetical protein SCP_1202000 [Sparassis crispa]GBE87974.1 hypothetical protein SCP_1202000 [Sparassis crispa]